MTIYFTDEQGNIHVMGLQKEIEKYEIDKWNSALKRKNYYPYRVSKSNTNGIFKDKQDLEAQLKKNMKGV